MNKKGSVVMAAAVLVLLAGSVVQARPEGDSRSGRMEKGQQMDERHEAMVKELGLSEEQQQKIQQHREAMKANRQAIRQGLRDKRDEMRQALEQAGIGYGPDSTDSQRDQGPDRSAGG